MKNIFLFLFILLNPVIGFSTINECKTDIYFANGILTKEQDAIRNTDLLEKTIRNNNEQEMYKNIGKVDYAYNSTVGMFGDLLESANQILDLNELEEQIEKDKQTIHDTDLDLQVKKYKKSILILPMV
ncbi:MAG: hypothetical protein K0U47_00350 [Epsilonproteobacteria bacterium]|nr:hypothetical protein [Campylobacterota bacterium]